MTWRDGAHLTGSPIWCDARRRRDVCFVSSADRVGRAGHGQLIGTPLTLALLGARGGGHLAVPLHRRFTLGTVRLELVASGRGLGAAALHVDIAGRTVLYAGVVRSVRGASVPIEAAEVRTSNAVVVAAPYGEERHRFPPLADTIARTTDWVKTELAADRRPVLFVDTALDGLEVAACLHAAGIAVAGGRPIRDAARRAGELLDDATSSTDMRRTVGAGADIAPGARGDDARSGAARADDARSINERRVSERRTSEDAAQGAASARGAVNELAPSGILAPGREPRAVVWLDSDRAGLARALSERAHRTALVSGRALDGSSDTDAAFAWSNASDREQLLEWIEGTSAREVFVTGACAEAIAAALGPRARVIGPPHQMTLFPSEATR